MRKTESTIPPPPPLAEPEPKVAANPQVRSGELSASAEQFAGTARHLPGNSDAEHRRAMGQAFADLSKVLPLLAGPDAGGGFEQRMRTIESARTRLSGEASMAPEPTIDEGLRAAAGALRDVARQRYAGQANIADSLDRLDKTVAELDVTKGGPHRAVATDAVRQMADVVHAMSDALAASVASPAGGQRPTGPTTRPSTP